MPTERPITIVSSQLDEKIALFSELRDDRLRKDQLIICDSEKVVVRLLKQKLSVMKILATPEFYQKHEALVASHPEAERLSAPHSLVETIVGHRLHKGVLALAKRPDDSSLAEIDGPIIALNGVNNSENVGMIIRNCHAFNMSHVIVDQKSCSPWVRRAIRVSMGSVFKTPISHVSDLLPLLVRLKEQGYQIFAADSHPSARLSYQIPFPKKTVLILGCEGEGIDPAIRDFAQRVIIPMKNGIDSLNVASAAAILMYEINRGL